MDLHSLTASTLQVYGKLLWPLKLFVTPAVEQTSAFLDLPIDILCSICDELPLSAKIILSHTCKAMWYMLRSKCSFQLKAIGREDRSNTLTELGNLLPDNYHCINCNMLHPVEPDNIPNLTNWYRRRHLCRAQYQTYNYVHPQHSYAVLFHHVQLALKYSRMKEKHQNYRRNILQNFEIRPVGSPIIKTFAAKPKVVNARFILLTTYILYAGPLRDAAKTDNDKYIMFCPHHHFGIGTGPGNSFAAMLQKTVINAATMQDQHTELFSCDRCPTDYSVVVEDDEAVLNAWHDLGNGFSVEDPSWQSHLYSDQNGLSKGLQFNYEHGSISKMYNSCYS
ncbi:hypothetical protein JMJ35_007518 [Cladonia borealis]|uniref:F-box domain-containing protein n=1 Tax=Cladonia borealis TaxID=184061 RepID=A0AA39QY69_9LECA|nr:hypothetical protein JMJ35_007518 [Cladonia borealis]